jgi:hypothetical protein
VPKVSAIYLLRRELEPLVFPYKLRSCLTTLKKNGFILKFTIYAQVVKVEHESQARFELAEIICDRQGKDYGDVHREKPERPQGQNSQFGAKNPPKPF